MKNPTSYQKKIYFQSYESAEKLKFNFFLSSSINKIYTFIGSPENEAFFSFFKKQKIFTTQSHQVYSAFHIIDRSKILFKTKFAHYGRNKKWIFP